MQASRPSRRSQTLALWLTAIGGAVDAVGYLLLTHIFVANMSGNTIALGMHAATGQWAQAIHRGYPILMFVIGLLLGGAIAEVQRRCDFRSAVAWSLMLEAILLAALLMVAGSILGWHARSSRSPILLEGVLIALPALAMGVQNVTLRASGALSAFTTHVTGSLTQMAEEAVCYGIWLWHWGCKGQRCRARRWRRLLRPTRPHPSLAMAAFLLGMWLAYVVGAFFMVAIFERWGVIAVAIPLAGVLAAAGWEFAQRRGAN